MDNGKETGLLYIEQYVKDFLITDNRCKDTMKPAGIRFMTK